MLELAGSPPQHLSSKTVSKGSPYPLGATPVADGVNFAVYSKTAQEVYLLLFATPAGPPTDVIRLQERDKFVWHACVKGLRAGQLYGYKMRGEYQPEMGLRFNESKLLLDPYAKALTGKFRNVDNLLLDYDTRSAAGPYTPDTRDNSAVVPKGIVVDDTAFDWQGVRSPRRGLEELIIYEVHPKGFTAHSSSGVKSPGTYLGFIEKIPYLVSLGVNAVELLPVHEHYDDEFLTARGQTNYWGYNSIGFFAPESSYATGAALGSQVDEFKTLVRELQRAGIQVILDVVYNHTPEGNEMGPTMSFRGLDNPSYYALTGPSETPRRYYMNWTGCGNSLNFDSPAVIRLVMDSLRYWIESMHVDGFRFDLASVLGRCDNGAFRPNAGFFECVSQDPVLGHAILIAEPWDCNTYQVGNFPVDWSEWNGRFRDTVRRFGKSEAGQLAEMGLRMTGSADLYGDDGRSAYNSVNFVCCHDGFTLNDLVSYNGKHNESNGESNQDGSNDNNSWNCGAEGDTNDPAIVSLRRQITKNHACTLLFACGTPMILGGDEFARTQRGNNNAYCQDNDISWFDWRLATSNADLFEFWRKAIAFTRRFPVLQQRKFLLGKDLGADGIPDLSWFGPSGSDLAWHDPNARTLCYQLDTLEGGVAKEAERLFFILNGHYESQWVNLPLLDAPRKWYRAIDTSLPTGLDFMEANHEVRIEPSDHYIANARSTVVLLAR
jgi:glycogen operon protein